MRPAYLGCVTSHRPVQNLQLPHTCRSNGRAQVPRAAELHVSFKSDDLDDRCMEIWLSAMGLVQSSDTVLSYPSQMNVYDCNHCLQVERQPCLTSYFFCSDLGLHT